MNIFHLKSFLAACIAVMMGIHGYAQESEASPRLSDYFSPATSNTISPDNEGFIQRWLLLEPIDKPNRSNTVFTRQLHSRSICNRVFLQSIHRPAQRRG